MEKNRSFGRQLVRVFDVCVVIVSLIAVLEVPVLYAFKIPVHGRFFTFELVAAAVLLLDIIRHFLFAADTLPRWQAEKSRACTYLKGWFIIDLVAAVPFVVSLSLVFYFPQQIHLLSGLYLLIAVKFLRIMAFAHKVAKVFSVNPSIVRLSVMMVWVVAIAHYLACVWVSLGFREDSFSGSFEVYLRACYFMTTTIATVGYGDITARTIEQTGFVIFVELVGVGIYGFVIGNIANVIANIDVAKTLYRAKQDRIDTFMRYRNIPADLQNKILEYYEYVWDSRRGYDESAVFNDLPINLKTKLSLVLNRDLIEKVPIFKGASIDLVKDIILKLEPIIFMPGDLIVEKGEIGYEMYFISGGSVDVVSEDGKTIYATLTAGQFFGEIALLLSSPRTATIRAKDYCDLYRLDKGSFDKILKKHDNFAQKMHELAEKRRSELDS
jgi:voltage-gated potassium channel